MVPLISITVCTYNGEDFIRNCLDSILNQDFKNFEVLCIDGGSKDKTREIINEYLKKDKRIKSLINRKRLPEGKGYGKWLGYNKSKGKIFGIIDQDNVLQRKNLFSNVAKIFKENNNLLGILGGMKHDFNDDLIVRYITMVGTDSFFAYRSIDFLRNIKYFEKIDSEEIEKTILKTDNLSITGGNCFFYRKKDLELVGGYTQDILVINELVKNKKNEITIINDSTKHYAEKSFFNLIKKKFKWGKFFKSDRNLKKFNYLPRTKREFFSFAKNLIFCLTILPNFYYSFRLYKKFKDSVAFLFPLVAFFNAIAYAITYLFHR